MRGRQVKLLEKVSLVMVSYLCMQRLDKRNLNF